MKRLVAILCVFLSVVSFAHAEVDLTGMSYDELLKLKEQVNAAIWATDEWQQVTVPAGIYLIGRDIPAGMWTIKPANGHTANISYGDSVDSTGTKMGNYNYTFQQITSPNDSYAKYNNIESVSWDLKDGYYILIEDSKVTFESYAGLGFSFN